MTVKTGGRSGGYIGPAGAVRLIMFGAFFDGIIFIFGFVEDILSWHNQAGVCFCARFFVPLTCTEDTGFAKLNYRLGGPLSAKVSC